jgi:mannose-1-phosphate guanylyltransferase
MFLWRRRSIRAELERYTGLIGLLEPTIRAPTLLAHAYEQLKPVSIDYAVMESAARDHRVVMGAMDVGWSDIGGWTALLTAIGAGGSGAVVQQGERVEASADDLVIRRIDGEVRLVRPMEAGSMTASQPVALLRGVDRAAVEALVARCARAEEAS